MVISLIFAVRAVCRTVRSTVALVLWVLKWSVVLYVVLLVWLWYSESEQKGPHNNLALVNHMVQSACNLACAETAISSSVLAMPYHAVQHQDQWRQLLSQALQLVQSEPRQRPRVKRRMTSSQRRSRENDKLRENLSDLAEALGFGDLYKSLVESDRRTERRAHLRKAQPAPTGFWKTEPI